MMTHPSPSARGASAQRLPSPPSTQVAGHQSMYYVGHRTHSEQFLFYVSVSARFSSVSVTATQWAGLIYKMAIKPPPASSITLLYPQRGILTSNQ